jgi:hypothetical protein
MESSNI